MLKKNQTLSTKYSKYPLEGVCFEYIQKNQIKTVKIIVSVKRLEFSCNATFREQTVFEKCQFLLENLAFWKFSPNYKHNPSVVILWYRGLVAITSAQLIQNART